MRLDEGKPGLEDTNESAAHRELERTYFKDINDKKEETNKYR